MVDINEALQILKGNLPPDIINGIGTVVSILKIIGIIFIIYLVFLIIKSISNMIANRRIKKIYKKVNEIDEKLDLLLSTKQKSKTDFRDDKSKKKGFKKDNRGVILVNE